MLTQKCNKNLRTSLSSVCVLFSKLSLSAVCSRQSQLKTLSLYPANKSVCLYPAVNSGHIFVSVVQIYVNIQESEFDYFLFYIERQRSERVDWPSVAQGHQQRSSPVEYEERQQDHNSAARYHRSTGEESSFFTGETEGRPRYTSRSPPFSQEPLQGYIFHKPDGGPVQYQQLDHNSNFTSDNRPPSSLQGTDYSEEKTALEFEPSARESPAAGISRYRSSNSVSSNSRSPVPPQEVSSNTSREEVSTRSQEQVFPTPGQRPHLTLGVHPQEHLLKQEEVEYFFSGLHSHPSSSSALTPQQHQHYHPHHLPAGHHQHQSHLQPQALPEGVVSRAGSAGIIQPQPQHQQQQPPATSHTPRDPPAPSDCNSATPATVSSSTPHQQHYPSVSPRDNITSLTSSSPTSSSSSAELKDPRNALVATTLEHHTSTGLSTYTSTGLSTYKGSPHHTTAMFQGANSTMTAMHPGTGPSAYADPTGQSFLHPGTGASPVYVPTTRAMLSAYMSGNGASSPQTTVSPNSATVWSAMQDTAQSSYSTSATHHGATVSSRFSFPPTPSPPGMGSPGSRTGETGVPAGFGSSLAARPAGLSAYSAYMGTADLTAWNGLYNSQVCPPFRI